MLLPYLRGSGRGGGGGGRGGAGRGAADEGEGRGGKTAGVAAAAGSQAAPSALRRAGSGAHHPRITAPVTREPLVPAIVKSRRRSFQRAAGGAGGAGGDTSSAWVAWAMLTAAAGRPWGAGRACD